MSRYAFLVASVVALSAGVGNASAVTRAPGGEGQVLIYPYYTTNAGNDTLLSVTNTTGLDKAVRVRFAEGENGRDVFSIDLYLAPFDTWTAVVTRPAESAPAGVRTSDESCTVPDIADAHDLAGGGAVFSTAAFSGAYADGGDTSNDRTSEGWIEIIEMATLIPGSPSADAAGTSDPNLDTRNCATLTQAWSEAGYWAQNPKTDVANPTGGLYGSASVVNVAQGTIFGYAATALDDFRVDPADSPRGTTASVALHTAPGDAHPNLADALSDPSTNRARAVVYAGGLISAEYAAPANAIDAVSATLMASAIYDEYDTDATLGATTSLVFTYPTRRFYTDPAIVGTSAIVPFTSIFAGVQRNANPELIPFAYADRKGRAPTINCGVDACLSHLQTPGTGIEIANFGTNAGATFASALTMTLPPGESPEAFAASGVVSYLTDGADLLGLPPNPPPVDGLPPIRTMRPDRNARYFSGFPVIGFKVETIVNGNIRQRVLANYSSLVPHRWISACYVPDELQGACGQN